MFVGGDSGVGKTRLLRELERLAVERGARVLRGDCLAFGADGLPYAPIAAALRGLARELEPAAFEELVGPSGGDLARLLPELSAAARRDEPGEGMTGTGEAIAQARLFGLLRALLDRLAAEAPVVFADRGHPLGRPLDARVPLLAACAACATSACCSSAPTAATSCTASTRCARSWPRRSAAHVVERLEVGAFSQAELAEQVAGILGGAAEPGLVARLHARCEGNAFFAEELLAASDAAAGPLPSSLRDVLNLRLEALPDDARGVLRVAAAAGRRSGHRLLAAVAGLPEPALVEALREAVAQHVLVQDADGYAFRHALLQEAAYADLLPGERTALHLALAEALRDDPSARRRARRRPSSRCTGAPRTACPRRSPPTCAPGLEAEQVFAFVEAAQHFERALEIWDLVEDADERAGARRCCGVVAHAAHNMHIAGEHHRAVTLGRMAHRARRPRPATWSPRRWPASASAATCGSRATATARWPPTATRSACCRPSRRRPRWRACSPPRRRSSCSARPATSRARRASARSRSRARSARARPRATRSTASASTRFGAGDFDGRRARAARGQAHRRGGLRPRRHLARLHEPQRVPRRAGPAGGGGRARARGRRQAPTASACAPTRSSCRARRAGGSPASAASTRRAAIVERVLAEGPKGVAAVVLHDNAAHLAMRRGRLDEAVEHFELARELLGGTSDSMWIGNQAAGRAETALWAADPERAWQLATGALDFVPKDQYAHFTTRLHATALRAAADRAQRARGARRRATAPPRRSATPARSSRACAPCSPPSAGTTAPPGPEPAAFDALERRGALAGRGAPRPARHGTRRPSASRR